MGGGQPNATESFTYHIAPTSGVFKNLTIRLSTAPGSGKSYAYTLMKNGVATALTATVSNTSTTASDTSNTVSVSAGDTLTLRCVPSGTPASSANFLSLSFDPDTDGESFLMTTDGVDLPTTGTYYINPAASGRTATNWKSTESSVSLALPPIIVKAIYIYLTTAPGSGKSRAFTLRSNAADTTVAVTISNTNTTGSVTGLNVRLVRGNKAAIRQVPTSTPAGTGTKFGILITCLPPTETLTDDFDDNSLDGAKWSEWAGGDVSETSQQLQITSTTSASYKGMDLVPHGTLVGSSVHVEVPHVLTGLTDAGTFLQVVKDSSNTLTMFVYNGTLTAEKQVATSYTTVDTDTYNASTHRWWQIRESGGTIYWEYSADGENWTQLASSTAFDVSDVYVSLFIGTDSANGSTDTALFDNFNLEPSITDTELVAANSAHAHSSESPALTQAHSLTAAYATHAHVAENVALTQAHTLAVADAAHTHTAESPTLVVDITLAVVDASHSHVAESPALTQAHTLVVAGATHSHSAESPALSQAHQLEAADATHSHSADSTALTQEHQLSVADAAHAHAAEAVSLTQAHSIVAADATHAHLSESAVLAQLHNLAAADASHSHVTEAPTLDQSQILAVQDALHNHSAESPNLTQAQLLAVLDALHAHLAESPALTQAHTMAAEDAAHGHTSESPTLSLSTILQVADAIHGHSAEVVALEQLHFLAVADAVHSHSAQSPTLSLSLALAAADALHEHTAEGNVLLGYELLLIVADALHSHLAESALLDFQYLNPFATRPSRTLLGGSRGSTSLNSRRNSSASTLGGVTSLSGKRSTTQLRNSG